MSHSRARRRARLVPALGGTLAAVLATSLTAGVPAAHAALPAAEVEPAAKAQSRTAGWLHREIGEEVYDTFGLGVDFYLSLLTLGGHPDDRSAAIDAMASRVDGYTNNQTSAGKTAKLTLAVETEGRDLATYAGGKLDGALEDLVVDTPGTELGRAKDSSETNNTNTVGQSLAVRVLTNLASDELEAATAFLLKQQCAGGWFRENMDSVDHSCDGGTEEQSGPSIDATGHAVVALVRAKWAGVPGLAGPIERAADWLETQQGHNGSFKAFGQSNANTTGLAAFALRRAGHRGAAGNAAAWVRRHQVDHVMIDRFPKLAGQAGAIAYSDADLAAAKKDGITDGSRISWWFATPDGGYALPSLLAARTLDVAAVDRAARGAEVRVTVRGLLKGERWFVRRGSTIVRKGFVPETGVVVTRVKMPDRRRTVTLSAYGSRNSRTGVEKVAVG
jgi:hypothetical protein